MRNWIKRKTLSMPKSKDIERLRKSDEEVEILFEELRIRALIFSFGEGKAERARV